MKQHASRPEWANETQVWKETHDGREFIFYLKLQTEQPLVIEAPNGEQGPPTGCSPSLYMQQWCSRNPRKAYYYILSLSEDLPIGTFEHKTRRYGLTDTSVMFDDLLEAKNALRDEMRRESWAFAGFVFQEERSQPVIVAYRDYFDSSCIEMVNTGIQPLD